MYKELVRTPLNQALVLLWVMGVYRLLGGLSMTPVSIAWIVSACFAPLTLAIIAGRFRKPQILPVGVLLGLGAVVAVASITGMLDIVQLITVIAAYAFLVWIIVLRALPTQWMFRLTTLLDVRGGYAEPGGRRLVEYSVHWSCFFLVVSVCLYVLAMQLLQNFAIAMAPWGVLIFSILMFWFSGRRYQKELYAYLFIIAALWGVISLSPFLFIDSHSYAFKLNDLHLGLVLSVSGVIALSINSLVRKLLGLEHFAYIVIPLRNIAISTAVLVAIQVFIVLLAGRVAAPGWLPATSIGIAGLVLLAANINLSKARYTLSGTILICLSVNWFYSAVFHQALPFGVWPAGSASVDQWIFLAAQSIALASLAQFLTRFPDKQTGYVSPIYLIAFLIYGWTLLGALGMLEANIADVPWLLAILIAGLFPLLRPLGQAPMLRSFGVIVLSTLLLLVLLQSNNMLGSVWMAMLVWAYSMWFAGNFILPSFSRRFPHMAMTEVLWPSFGLIALLAGLLLSQLQQAEVLPWQLMLVFAGYMILVLRNSSWQGFTWLAVISFTLFGILFSTEHQQLTGSAVRNGTLSGFMLEMLIWANILILCIPMWRRYGEALTTRFGWNEIEMLPPLRFVTFAIGTIWLAILVYLQGLMLIAPSLMGEIDSFTLLLGALLTVSYLHAMVWHYQRMTAHLFITSLFFTVLSCWSAVTLIHISVLLSLWSLFITTTAIVAARSHYADTVNEILSPWMRLSLFVTLISMLIVPGLSIPQAMLSFGLLAIVFSAIGVAQLKRNWIVASIIMLLIVIHGVWFAWLPIANPPALLAWYSLEIILLAWALTIDRGKISDATGVDDVQKGLSLIRSVLYTAIPWLVSLAVIEWLSYVLFYTGDLLGGLTSPWRSLGWNSSIALFTSLLLLGLSIRTAYRIRGSIWVYVVAIAGSMTAVYCRLLIAGLSPVSVWDTAALIIIAYSLLILQHYIPSRPVYHLLIVVPLLALLTIPMQLGSLHAGLTLIAIGSLYLLTCRTTDLNVPMYLGLLAINGSIYLWVPAWVDTTGLLQVYLIPAGITVLMLLHLHRDEIAKSTLNGTRLATLSVLYATATMDVFITEDLAIFILALALSTTGVLVGIGMRARAFLYTGIAFLVINVLGQMIQLYPEQRLGRAIILMVLGAGITGTMIWFNIQRELIMGRIRIFRADLEAWE